MVLLGGTSHTGKSTLGGQLANVLGWRLLSTDQLARHPGRPWRDTADPLPDDVARHYADHSAAQLVDVVTRHYRDNVWPIVAAIVRSHVNNPFDPGLVLEGSAILPDCVADASLERTLWAWLRTPDDILTERIRASSGFAGRGSGQQRLISAFLARSLEFQRDLESSVERHGMQQLDSTDPQVLEKLVSWCQGGRW